MNRIIIAQDPERKDISRHLLREIDREDLVINLVAFGLRPAGAEADDTKVVVLFVGSEIENFENRYLTNDSSMVVPLVRLAYAREYWRNLLTLWKSKLRQIYAAE